MGTTRMTHVVDPNLRHDRHLVAATPIADVIDDGMYSL